MSVILNSQKNKSLEVITGLNLNPKDFVRDDSPNELVYHYKDTKLYFNFSFRPNTGDFIFNYSKLIPKYELIGHPLENACQFDDCLKYFGKWLANDVRVYIDEENTPDKWLDIEAHFHGSHTSAGLSFSKEAFTNEEIRQIEGYLDNFETFAKEKLQLTDQQLKDIAKELKELREDVKRLTKNKWLRNFGWFAFKELLDVLKNEDKRQLAISYLKTTFQIISNYLPLLNNPLP
jgi:hypothetical protein